MNVAETHALRPSHRDVAGRRIEAILKCIPADKTLSALAPFSGGSAAEMVSAMFSEADGTLAIALDILEWHLEGAERGTWGSKLSDLLFAAQRRLQYACTLNEKLIASVTEGLRDEAPRSHSRARPTEITHESAATAVELLRTIDAELTEVCTRAKDGSDTLAEERRVEGFCGDLERLQRLARTAADMIAPFDAGSNEPTHDAE